MSAARRAIGSLTAALPGLTLDGDNCRARDAAAVRNAEIQNEKARVTKAQSGELPGGARRVRELRPEEIG